VYAISTLGSFIGTFLPVLVMIPLLGTAKTFISFSIFLTVVALVGLWLVSGWRSAIVWIWMIIFLLAAGYFLTGGPIKSTTGQIFEAESAYNYIQVLEKDGYRMLRLNEGQGIHSMWHPTDIDFEGPWKQFLVAPFFNEAPYPLEKIKSMAIIGLAAGTTARQATEVFGPIPIDGFEIDPGVIEVGETYFDMNEPNLNAIAEDGRVGLERSQKKYSIIGVDAYRPPYIPWHLTTQEFFQLVYDHLSDDGAMVINVGRSPSDRRLIDHLVGTIRTVFPSIYVMDIPDTFNSIIYATVQPTNIENLYNNLLALYPQKDVPPLLINALELMVTNQQPVPDSQVVYTDDWAPIEWITNSMVLNYLLAGDMEALK
jgi:predicted membrane-bound spermidine synthase